MVPPSSLIAGCVAAILLSACTATAAPSLSPDPPIGWLR